MGKLLGFSAFLLLVLGAAAIGTSASERVYSRRPAAKTQELLPSTDEASKNVSADSTVAAMYVSHAYEATDPRAHADADILAIEAQAMNDFLEGRGEFARFRGIPAARKGLILRRYEVGDKRVIDALIKASKLGLKRSLVITDFNTSMTGTFKEGQKHNSDWESAKLNSSAMAEGVQRLLKEGGYKYNDLMHGIVSQPLYNGDMIPIMHHKDMFFVIYDERGNVSEIVFYTGTNNMTDNPRYNRMFQLSDQQLAQYVLDNALAMAGVFAKGGEIKDIQSKPPLKLTYRDGSSVEIAFTDGKFNPNDRMQKLLEAAAGGAEGHIKMKTASFSEFVFTDANVLEGLRSAMKANPEMTVFGVFDDKFLAFDEYGKAEVLAGYSTAPPFGKSNYGFSSDLRKRVEAYGYQRKAEGREETDTEGPPTSRHLWHDKTAVFEYTEDGVEWVEVHTGSFNLSTKGTNAELQLKYRVPAASPLGKMVLESIAKVARAEPEYALPLDIAVFRNFLAKFTGHSVFEITRDSTESIMKQLKTAKYKPALDAIRDIAREPTTLKKKIAEADMQARVEKLEKFFDWNAHVAPETAIKGLSPQRFAAAAFGVAHPEALPGRVLQLMRSALWNESLSDDQLEARARDAMNELGLKPPVAKDDSNAGDDEDRSDPREGLDNCKDALTKKKFRGPGGHAIK